MFAKKILPEAWDTQALLAELAKQVKVFCEKRFEERVLEDGIFMDETLLSDFPDMPGQIILFPGVISAGRSSACHHTSQHPLKGPWVPI